MAMKRYVLVLELPKVLMPHSSAAEHTVGSTKTQQIKLNTQHSSIRLDRLQGTVSLAIYSICSFKYDGDDDDSLMLEYSQNKMAARLHESTYVKSTNAIGVTDQLEVQY